MFLGSLSRHNKDLERRTLKPSARHSSWVLNELLQVVMSLSPLQRDVMGFWKFLPFLVLSFLAVYQAGMLQAAPFR